MILHLLVHTSHFVLHCSAFLLSDVKSLCVGYRTLLCTPLRLAGSSCFYEEPRFLFPGFLDPTLWFTRPDPRGFSQPDPRGFLSPNLWFSRPDPHAFSARTSGFLDRPSGFLSTTLGFSEALLGHRCPSLRVYSSHAGLCGHDCPRVVVRPVPTSPGLWFPYLQRPEFVQIFSPPTSRALPFTDF